MTTGFPELDRLIGSPEPLTGFPGGLITTVDGTEIPKDWAGYLGALVCSPDPHEIGRAVLLSRPPIVFVMREPLECDYEKLQGLLRRVGTALEGAAQRLAEFQKTLRDE